MIKKRKASIALIVTLLFAFSLIPVAWGASAVEDTMTLATTTSTQDSGLLDVLVPAFEKEYKTKVKVVAVGSGQAMEMGKRGDADVLLVHSRKAEDEFVASGFGINRKDVMHNEFLIAGPASDPAGINGMTSAVDAFKKIAAAKAKFISRGDKSGTNTKELDIWKKAEITPAEPWYIQSGQGMGDTLNMANEMIAYTLADEATFLSWKGKTDLKVSVQGDKVLFNPYGVIQVNPEKFPTIHQKAAQAFSDFITGTKGQLIIYTYGKDKYGKALFTPDAIPLTTLAAASAPKVVKKPTTTYVYTTVKTNIRSGPSNKYKVLTKVKSNTKLVLLSGNKNGWIKVKYNKITGYVWSKSIKKK